MFLSFAKPDISLQFPAETTFIPFPKNYDIFYDFKTFLP